MNHKKKLLFASVAVLVLVVISVVICFFVGFNQKPENKKEKKEDKVITYVKEQCMTSYPIKEYQFKKEVLENKKVKVHVNKDGKEKFYYIVDPENPVCEQVGVSEPIKALGAGEETKE
ncbi:MAG: hypothetical protein KH135_06925 [Firmicutes bacterium]|nr:hypothetical protein [Bacillota bacterium]